MTTSNIDTATNLGSAAAIGEGREISPSDAARRSKVSTAPISHLDAETERSIARGMEMANAIDSLFDSLMGAKR